MILFSNNIELKKYAQIAVNFNFDSCRASLEIVEQKHIIPIIGADLYKALGIAMAAATTQDPLPEQFTNLLHQCRMVAGPLFCFVHADKADVNFSDAGMQRLETATNKSAFQEQRTKFKEANLSEGEAAIELLFQFLENNIGEFEEWKDSPAFARYRSMFIKTGAEFDAEFPSASPHRNYWAMRSKMYDVEENNIRPFLGDELFDYLKTELAKPDPALSDEEILLLKKLKKAIVNLTVAFSIPFLNVRIDAGGLTVSAFASFSTNDRENTRSGANDKALNAITNSCNATGTDWLTNATNYLTNNPDAFPTWIGFVTTAATEEACSDNEDLNGSFGMF